MNGLDPGTVEKGSNPRRPQAFGRAAVLQGGPGLHSSVPAGGDASVGGSAIVGQPSILRNDIQALRGYAVAIVVLYHLKLLPLPNGYLGVDIFFVISGFLITGWVSRAMEAGTFRFSDFYLRRAKRLLPAAYVVLLSTALLAPWALSTIEYDGFVRQVLGSLTMSENLVMLKQADYFNDSAELKPLLHIWSLAIEEQYYAVLPAFLMLVPTRHWRTAVVSLTMTSFLACMLAMHWKPVAAFYLLPTRAWELGLGSIGALLRDSAVVRRVAQRLFIPGALWLTGVPWMAGTWAHPGWLALSTCTATLGVILARSSMRPLLFGLPLGWLATLGNCSYSLYLVHWPVIALFNNVYIGEKSAEVSLYLLGLSILLAWGLYRYVELPIHQRRLKSKRPFVVAILASSAMLALLPLLLHRSNPANFVEFRTPNAGFSRECESGSQFVVKSVCQSTAHPEMLIWGDSNAMHLVTGAASVHSQGVLQATRSLCGPLIDLAPLGSATTPRSWAESCIAFNDSVLAFLRTSKDIHTVVLASVFQQYLQSDAPSMAGRSLLVRASNNFEEVPLNSALALRKLEETVRSIHALGMRVVVVAPPPRSTFDVGRCLERKATHRFTLGGNADCTISSGDDRKVRASVIDFFSRAQQSDIAIRRLDELLCNSLLCQTQHAGTFLYMDAGHLSYAGSAWLVPQLRLDQFAR